MKVIARLVHCTAVALLAVTGSAEAVRGQSAATRELKYQVAQLRRSFQLTLGSTTIAASSPLASVYERAAFALLWTDARAVNDLLRVLGRWRRTA